MSSAEIVTVFTVTMNSGSVQIVERVATDATLGPAVELTVDALARQVGLPVRTIREYQTLGLLPPPRKRGRVGIYGAGHLRWLRLIVRLQERGYSLAGIRDLLSAWQDGAELGEVLGLEPDQLVHIDEPGVPATAEQLARLLPDLVPDRLDDLLASGVLEACGPGRYCVPSPSMLQLTADALASGYDADRIMVLLRVINEAADSIAHAAASAIGERPAGADPRRLVAFATRGRGLLAHGTGRLTIHRLGRRLGITDEATAPERLRRVLEADEPAEPRPPTTQELS
jgi:DNA-binding transcriptional MerR regulator